MESSRQEKSFVVMGLDPGFHHFGWAVVTYHSLKEKNIPHQYTEYCWPELISKGTLHQQKKQKKNSSHGCAHDFSQENAHNNHGNFSDFSTQGIMGSINGQGNLDHSTPYNTSYSAPQKNHGGSQNKYPADILHCGYLYQGLISLFQQYKPQGVIMEKIIIPSGKNPMSSVVLGYGRAMALLTIAQYENPLHFHEVAPTEVKRLIGGHGKATKEDIRNFFENLYGVSLDLDESDALAMACCAVFL